MALTLGQLIRQRRMELGLTQEELAERVGGSVRQAEISRLERDRVTLPRRARLEDIARALDVPLGVLLARSGWVGAQDAFPEAAAPATATPTAPDGDDDAPGQPASRSGMYSNLADDVPQLSNAISRARELSRRTDDVMRQARMTFDRAQRTTVERRKPVSPPADSQEET